MQGPFKRKGGYSPGVHQDKQGAWFALIAIWGLLYFVVAVVGLHILRSELNPIRHAVSNYAVGPFGFFMTAAFFALALSEVALALGLARSLTTSRGAFVSVLLLNLAGAGMAVTGIFPGDVKSLHPPATTTALIHWTGAGISFLSLMIATFLLSRCFKTDARWQSFYRPAFALAVAVVLALGVFGMLTIIGWVGVGERIYLAASVLWLLRASVRLRTIATSKTEGIPDVPLSGCGFSRRHPGISLEPEARCGSGQTLLREALAAPHNSTPRVITVDKNAAYPKAFKELKAEATIPDSCELRQSKYLNNLVEQDHRFIKRLVKLGMGFFSFETAWRTLQGYEAMHMRRSGQIHVHQQ